MKKHLLILTSILLACTTGSLLAQQITFDKVYYDGNFTEGYSVTNAYGSGYVIAGSNSYGGFVMKLDTAGNQIWKKQFNDNTYEAFNAIIRTNDSCYALTGKMRNPATGKFNIACIKLNAAGDTLWSKIIVGATNEQGFSIQQTFDRGYIISGLKNNSTAPYSSMVAVKVDSTGSLEWKKVFTIGTSANVSHSIKQTADSGFVMLGCRENSSPYLSSATLFKLTPSGNVSWAKIYNRPTSNYGAGIDLIVKNDGYVCLMSVAGGVLALVKTDFSGNVLWSKNYSVYGQGTSYSSISPFHSTSDGGYILTNGGAPPNSWGQEVVKIDSSGTPVWLSYANLYPMEVIESPDHGYFLLGNGPLIGVHPLSTNQPQIGVVKTDSLGSSTSCFSTSGGVTVNSDNIASGVISVTPVSGGSSISIHPTISIPTIVDYDGCVSFLGAVNDLQSENTFTVSPNPFSDQTILSFKEKQSKSNVQIIDVLGKIIFSSSIPENSGNFVIHKGNLNSGIYFIQISSDKETISKKIIIQ